MLPAAADLVAVGEACCVLPAAAADSVAVGEACCDIVAVGEACRVPWSVRLGRQA